MGKHDGWTPEQERDYTNCLRLVEHFFDGTEKAVKWMATSNPLLGDFSPQEMIRRGRTSRLVQFLRMAQEERE